MRRLYGVLASKLRVRDYFVESCCGKPVVLTSAIWNTGYYDMSIPVSAGEPFVFVFGSEIFEGVACEHIV